ncbi:4-alpha-glucanotransferase [Burkholderiaceae bacterium 26]|nr:4-alpha-glucanotransferase [Burkholderiaceae bacterium 26]
MDRTNHSSGTQRTPLQQLATDAGLLVDWEDAASRPMRVADEVLRAVLFTLGLPAGTSAQVSESQARLRAEAEAVAIPPLVTGVVGQPIVLQTSAPQAALLGGQTYRVDFESDGSTDGKISVNASERHATLRLAPVQAVGYHRLTIDAGPGTVIEATLAIAPARCYGVADALRRHDRPADTRLWGASAQLYGLRCDADRAASSAGLGDYTAAGTLARHLAQRGADAFALSPVHAMFTADARRYSPYSPSSRLFLNAWMIDPAALFGDEAVRQTVVDCNLVDDYARLEAAQLIDWPASGNARMTVLRALHRRLLQAPLGDTVAQMLLDDFRAYCIDGGTSLRDHAHFEALNAHLGPAHWKQWPEQYQHPSYLGVQAFAREHEDAVNFHLFLQWAAARQWALAQRTAENAGMAIGLIADLAVGTDSAGSHAWARQRDLLIGVTVGAPPDVFNAQGQGWGLTTFSPRAMRTQGFSAFIEMLRAVMAVPGGVRIDHVLGLMRLWVIPDGARPLDGVYLRYPMQDLLRLVALESWRNRCIVIGEDLGTVPPGLRDKLADDGLLGMRILWFEREYTRDDAPFKAPRTWAPASVAMTSTHDLPTLVGWWIGNDLRWQAQLGLLPAGMSESEAHARRMDDRAALVAAFVEHNRLVLADGGVPMIGVAPLLAALEQARMATAAQADVILQASAQDFATAATVFTGAANTPLALVPLEDLLGLVEQPNLPSTIDTHPNWRRRLPGPSGMLLDAPTVQARLSALANARISTP